MNLFSHSRYAACLLLGLGLMAGTSRTCIPSTLNAASPLASEPPQALAGAETQDDDVLPRLSTLWQKQHELMQHGRFEALVLRLSPPDRQKMTVDEFNGFLTELDLKNVPAFMQKLLDRFPAEPGVSWLPLGPIVVRDDGKRRFESWPVDSADPKKGHTSRYTDGSVYVGYEPRNRQVSIDQPTIAVLGINDFRRLPIGPGATLIKQWRVAERKNGRVTLRLSNKAGLEEIEADEKTGFVFRHRHSWTAEKGTDLVVLQFGPVIDKTGRVLPVLNMEVFFRMGLVDRVFAHHVIKADMDSKLTKGDFAVPVPAGTKVFDFRGDRAHPKFRPTREAVPDVLAFATAVLDEDPSIWPRLKYGMPAPKLDVASWLTNEGKTKQPNLEGKAILISFWGVSSGPCLFELPAVQGAAKELGEKGVLLIGLHDSRGNLEEVAEFARKQGLTYQLAIDRPAEKGASLGTTFQAFGIPGMPNAALVDGKGRLVFVGRFKEARQKAIELLKAENPFTRPMP